MEESNVQPVNSPVTVRGGAGAPGGESGRGRAGAAAPACTSRLPLSLGAAHSVAAGEQLPFWFCGHSSSQPAISCALLKAPALPLIVCRCAEIFTASFMTFSSSLRPAGRWVLQSLSTRGRGGGRDGGRRV